MDSAAVSAGRVGLEVVEISSNGRICPTIRTRRASENDLVHSVRSGSTTARRRVSYRRKSGIRRDGRFQFHFRSRRHVSGKKPPSRRRPHRFDDGIAEFVGAARNRSDGRGRSEAYRRRRIGDFRPTSAVGRHVAINVERGSRGADGIDSVSGGSGIPVVSGGVSVRVTGCGVGSVRPAFSARVVYDFDGRIDEAFPARRSASFEGRARIPDGSAVVGVARGGVVTDFHGSGKGKFSVSGQERRNFSVQFEGGIHDPVPGCRRQRIVGSLQIGRRESGGQSCRNGGESDYRKEERSSGNDGTPNRP